MNDLPNKVRKLFRQQMIEDAAIAVQTCQRSLQLEKKFDKALLAGVKIACVSLSRLFTNDTVIPGKHFLTELAEDVKYQPAEFATRVFSVLAIYQSAVDLVRINAILDPCSNWTCLKDLEKLCETTEKETLGFPYFEVLKSVEEMREELTFLRSNDLVFLENEEFPHHVIYVGTGVNDGIFHKRLTGPKLAQGIVTLTLAGSVPDDFSEAQLKEGQSSVQIKYGDEVAVSCPAYRYPFRVASLY